MRFDKPAAFQIQSIAYKSHYENVPFEIPESWVWTSIGELFEHNTGKALNASNRDGKMMDYITTSNLYWDRFDLSVVKQMLFTEEELWRCTAKKGDLLICEGGDIGRAAIWNYDYDIRIQNHIHRLRGYKGINHRFYYFVFLLYKLSNRIGGKGVAIQGLSSGDLHKLEVPLPPEYEQIRLVKTIEKWFKFVDLLEQEQENLHTLVQSTKIKILDLAISGKLVPQDPNDEPAIELLKRINPDFQPCDNSHYENLPFEIPSTWVWVSHNDMLEISGGAQPPKSEFSEVMKPGYIRLYQIRDYGEKPIPIYIPLSTASKTTVKGDILLARYGGSLGKVFIAEDGAYNVAMAKVILCYPEVLNQKFVYYYYLSSIYQNKLRSISRTAQAGFNSGDFEDMYFPLPPLEEQGRIVDAISSIWEMIDMITAEL